MAKNTIKLQIKRTIRTRSTLQFITPTTARAPSIPQVSLAGQTPWTEREICRAAVNTYFSLEKMPDDSEDNGDFMGFKSAAGYIYTCRLEGNIAILKWVNATNDAMISKKTSFKLNGNTLVVTDNSMGATKTFTKG